MLRFSIRSLLVTTLALGCVFFFSFVTPPKNNRSLIGGDGDNAGLKLPEGFTAHQIIESSAKTRHLAVTPEGIIYVKLARPKEGKGILILHEDANGKATITGGFGNYGGTGICLKNGYLYASSNEEIFRYKLNEKNEVIHPDQPEKIVTGLKAGRQHETKSIVLDNDGNIYVNIGSPLNSARSMIGKKGLWE